MDILNVEEDFDTRYVDYFGNRYIFYGAQHLSRYLWALQFVKNKKVLDVGCGSGYGTAILAKSATEVIGIDKSENAVNYARNRFTAENTRFYVKDILNDELFKEKFDVILSFEVIEHLKDIEIFLNKLIGLLADQGRLIIGTPNLLFRQINKIPDNPFHLKEYTPEELKGLLGKHFNQVEIYGQKIFDPRKRADYISEARGESGLRKSERRFPFWIKTVYKFVRIIIYFIFKPFKIYKDKDIGFTRDRLEEAFNILAVCKELK